jgi:hypothetical protein
MDEMKTCSECGAIVKVMSWARHLLTIKHKKGKVVKNEGVKPFECRSGVFKVGF